MRRMTKWWTLAALFWILGPPVPAPRAQQAPGSILQTTRPPDPMGPMGPNLPSSAREKVARAQNEERQKRLEADTDKLLQLATQLHTDVAKTDKNILSVDVIKRAEEIEKLAHAVKERMRGQG